MAERAAGGPLPPGFLDQKLEEIVMDAGLESRASAEAGASAKKLRLGSVRAVGAVALTTSKGDGSFEAVHRGRYLPDEEKEEWHQHRADALSGDRLKPWIFAKAALYELFPGFISVWLILILEAGNHNLAANRNLSPFKKFPLGIATSIVDVLLLAPYVSFALWLYYRPAGVDLWEVLFTFCFPLMRSLVIGSKYGYYTDIECAADTGFGGKKYEVEDRMNKKLASNWVCNLHDQLYSVLLEELYEASIRVDCDLSKASFDVGVPIATAIWAESKVTLAKALEQAAKPGMGFESQKVERQKWGHHRDLQVKVFGPQAAIEEEVQKGQMPASLMAWKCACDCYYISPKSGPQRFFSLALVSLLMASIAPLCRLSLGRSAFGDTGAENAVLGLGAWGSGAGFFLMLFYVVAPSWDFKARYRAAQFMCDLMGEGVSLNPPTPAAETETAPETASLGLEVRAAGDRTPPDASRRWQGAPQKLQLLLDMRQSENVLAWSLVRRSVACAGEFGHSFYLRFQVYSFLLFGGSCAYVTAMTFASKNRGTMDTVSFVHVMTRVAMLVGAVLMQVASGYNTNRMGAEMKSLLVREKISIQSQLSGGSSTSLSQAVRERMNQSCELLDSVGEQIDLDSVCKPTRVMGAPAEPPAVTGVISVVLLALTFLTEGVINGDIRFV